MFEGVDTVVLHDELAYEDLLPVAWRPLREALDPVAIAAMTDRNIKLMMVCAAIEESGPVDKPDDKSPHAADLQRLEIKMNLTLDLLGQILAASSPRPPVTSIRFNALGAAWRARGEQPLTNTQGLLEIYLRESLPQPLTLLARIVSVSPEGLVKAAVVPPGEATADLIEKLAFRRHRRQVAGVRQPRRG